MQQLELFSTTSEHMNMISSNSITLTQNNIEILEITKGKYKINLSQEDLLSKQDLERLVIEIQKILLYSKS